VVLFGEFENVQSMSLTMNDRDRECPACGETRLVEFDAVTLRWYCAVCSESWRNRPGRHVPVRPAQRSLPGTFPSLDLQQQRVPTGGHAQFSDRPSAVEEVTEADKPIAAERQLAAAVIALSVSDTQAANVVHRRQAAAWLTSPTSGLAWWCPVAGLDVDAVREGIARVLAGGGAKKVRRRPSG
jgi:hypothetical protein